MAVPVRAGAGPATVTCAGAREQGRREGLCDHDAFVQSHSAQFRFGTPVLRRQIYERGDDASLLENLHTKDGQLLQIDWNHAQARY